MAYPYILHWFSGKALTDEIVTPVLFAGPFENDDAASEWGERWQAEHGDNPCWQLVRMRTYSQISFDIPVIAPAD